MTTKRVLVKKDIVKGRMKKVPKFKYYSVPQFSTKEGEIPVFKVKSASLDDQLQATQLSSAPTRVLMEIARNLKRGKDITLKEIQSGIFDEDQLNPKTIFQIHLFRKCLISPTFTYDEAFEFSETYPDLMNDICISILGVEERENGN